MSYAIIRNTNYKMKNLAGIYRHNERKNTHYSNKEIQKDKSNKNYSIKQPGKEVSKIACSSFWKGKNSYKNLQDNFYSYMTKANFQLERGNAKRNEHIDIEKLKKITNYELQQFEKQSIKKKKLFKQLILNYYNEKIKEL